MLGARHGTQVLVVSLLLCASVGGAPETKRYPGVVEIGGVLKPPPVVAPGKKPATGLQRPFPQPPLRATNPTTRSRVELGRFLFYDPLLSGDNTMSCAHCHHPDLGFSDGLARSRGKGARGIGKARRGGVELSRAAPTLWNALYNHRQFWDGRARDLEEQAGGPIADANEMAEKPERLVAELRNIEEYRRLFQVAFGAAQKKPAAEAVTLANVTNAIAAFERTLVSFNSRFDRYAAGDGAALTASEVRGLKLFLSTKTRCNECHTLPTFSRPSFRVIGVPQPKDGPHDKANPQARKGRGGGPDGAFKVPTVRNIALTAPYMHNGVFKTLEEVLDFYAGGGGRGLGLAVPQQDDKIRKFDLTPTEKADMVAFLKALTDVSALPKVPEKVPSGLPVVGRLPVPADTPHGRKGERVVGGSGITVEVRPGESIQVAVDKAGRGGAIRVHPGVYEEDVLVIQHGVKLVGLVVNGKRAVLEGKGVRADAVVAMGHDFSISGFEIRNYQGNGVVVHGARNVSFRNLVVRQPGLYGVYPVECENVVVEGCSVSGARDAGIYVGQSRRIVVRKNEAFRNVAGIEIENSVRVVVEDNHVYENTGGILVFLLPFNPSKEARDTRVVRNRVVNNNTANFADPNATVANVLAGTGILVLAADGTEVTDNDVAGNKSYGIAVSGLAALYPPGRPLDVDPHPDGNWIHGNRLSGNGKSPDERLIKRGLPGKDLLWDGTGKKNAWEEPAGTRFPAQLPVPKGKDK